MQLGGVANGAKASFAVSMPKRVMSTGAKRAVTGIGMHSVTHQTTTRANMQRRE